MTAPPGELLEPPAGQGEQFRGRPAGTSYSELGITGITPILGLFRYPLPCAREGPATWDDALWRLSPVGIIRCGRCLASSLTFSAHGDGAAVFVRTGGFTE